MNRAKGSVFVFDTDLSHSNLIPQVLSLPDFVFVSALFLTLRNLVTSIMKYLPTCIIHRSSLELLHEYHYQ